MIESVMIQRFLLKESLCLTLRILLNYRGSSMNLGVQAIHRVLTREIPINDKKSKKRY